MKIFRLMVTMLMLSAIQHSYGMETSKEKQNIARLAQIRLADKLNKPVDKQEAASLIRELNKTRMVTADLTWYLNKFDENPILQAGEREDPRIIKQKLAKLAQIRLTDKLNKPVDQQEAANLIRELSKSQLVTADSLWYLNKFNENPMTLQLGAPPATLQIGGTMAGRLLSQGEQEILDNLTRALKRAEVDPAQGLGATTLALDPLEKMPNPSGDIKVAVSNALRTAAQKQNRMNGSDPKAVAGSDEALATYFENKR